MLYITDAPFNPNMVTNGNTVEIVEISVEQAIKKIKVHEYLEQQHLEVYITKVIFGRESAEIMSNLLQNIFIQKPSSIRLNLNDEMIMYEYLHNKFFLVSVIR